MESNLKVDYLILGGGIAGTTAAEIIRQRSSGSVMIVTDDAHTLYSRVRLPDYVAGSIPREKVFVKGEAWYKEQRIDLVRETAVIALSPSDRSVTLSNGKKIQYGKLLLATGGKARKLEFEGPEKEGVYTFRTLEDAERIKEAMANSKKAVVLGGGYIGLELVRCSIQHGLATCLVVMENQFWPQALDEVSSKMVENALRKKGVEVYFQSQIQTVMGNGKVESIILSEASGSSGTERGVRGRQCFDCDFLGIGIGVTTMDPFIETSGLQIKKGILTDETLKTTDANIYAAGDVAEFYDPNGRKHYQFGNWVNAAGQGKVAGMNMTGDHQIFHSVSSYAIRLFGLSIGFSGETKNEPGTTVIRRGSPEEGYVRLFVRDGKVKGASLINRAHEMRPVLEMIRKEIQVNHKESDLGNTDFELDSLF